MTICNMTIFSKISKYDYLQYEYFFKNLVIFRLKNMTKKKTYGCGGCVTLPQPPGCGTGGCEGCVTLPQTPGCGTGGMWGMRDPPSGSRVWYRRDAGDA